MNENTGSGFEEGCRTIIDALHAAVATVERDRARAQAALDRLVSSGNPRSEELTALSAYIDETMADAKASLETAAAAMGVLPPILARSKRVLDATARRMEQLLPADAPS